MRRTWSPPSSEMSERYGRPVTRYLHLNYGMVTTGCDLDAGEADREGRASSRTALHVDGAAVRFGDPLADGETEAGAGTLARARARRVGAPEPVEDVRQIPGRDPDPGVGDAEHGTPVAACQLHGNLPAARCVLHGVLDEIERELAHAAAVYRHHDGLRRHSDLDPHPGLLGQQLSRLPCLGDDIAQIDRFAVELSPAFVGARQGQ